MGGIVALLTRKGGSGSSTIAANIGAEWYARGRSVRVLDCDPKRSLAMWAGLGEGGALQAIVEPVETQQGVAFRSLVERIAAEVDRLVIDCAPGFDPLALQAASLAHVAVIPVRPSLLDLSAALDALQMALLGVRDRKDACVAFAPSAELPRTQLGLELPEQLAQLWKEDGVHVLPAVSARIVVAEAALSGQAVREVEPDGPSAREFAALTDAVEALLP
jgi:chromosome partitioning protein